MIRQIARDEVQRLAGTGARIVEVLPAGEYGDLHLPGAVNIPLRRLVAEAPGRLGADRPVVVYCYDHQ
jgi:rhodanese-related sulfurtransferase